MTDKKIIENLTKVKVDVEELVRLRKLAKARIIDIVRQGITDRFTIEILYEKEWRIINPHCYFFKKKNVEFDYSIHNDYVNAFQIGGFSKSEKLNAWKLYRIDKIKYAKILNPVKEFKIEKSFKPDSNYYGTGFKHSVNYSC